MQYLNAYLAFISFVSPSCKYKSYNVNKERTCNCHEHWNVARLAKSSKLRENFVEVNGIGSLNEVSAERRQMVAETFEMRGVRAQVDLPMKYKK